MVYKSFYLYREYIIQYANANCILFNPNGKCTITFEPYIYPYGPGTYALKSSIKTVSQFCDLVKNLYR